MNTPTQQTGGAKLSSEHREAMWHVRNGADISDPYIAKHLRRVERDFPELIWIGKPMGQYDSRKHVPYFGAILTEKGKEAIGLPGDFAPHYVE